ncbi:MAG: hypothetical protein WA999_04650, partial [Spirulinaceae cyanobacterium]
SQWFFFPRIYGSEVGSWKIPLDYDKVSVYRYGGQGNAIVSELSGGSGESCYAVFLPAQTEVLIKNVPVTYIASKYVGYSHRTGRFESMFDDVFIIAALGSRSFTANGESFETWLGIDSIDDNRGEVDYENLEEVLLKKDLSEVKLGMDYPYTTRFLLREQDKEKSSSNSSDDGD